MSMPGHNGAADFDFGSGCKFNLEFKFRDESNSNLKTEFCAKTYSQTKYRMCKCVIFVCPCGFLVCVFLTFVSNEVKDKNATPNSVLIEILKTYPNARVSKIQSFTDETFHRKHIEELLNNDRGNLRIGYRHYKKYTLRWENDFRFLFSAFDLA